MRIVPREFADKDPRIGVDEQLVGVEPVAFSRAIGTMRPQSVKLACLEAWHVAVPYFVCVLGQRYARRLGLATGIEKADLDAGCIRREYGKIDTAAVVNGPKRIRRAPGDAQAGAAHACPPFRGTCTNAETASGGNVSVSENGLP